MALFHSLYRLFGMTIMHDRAVKRKDINISNIIFRNSIIDICEMAMNFIMRNLIPVSSGTMRRKMNGCY